MDPKLWHKVAGISGVAALGLGTYGAHFFKPQNPSYKDVSFPFFSSSISSQNFSFLNYPHFFSEKKNDNVACLYEFMKVWQTASLYHLVHTAALLGAPLTKNPNIFGGLLTTGILAFSGTCYTVAYLEDRKYSRLAPFGGFAFIAAWGSLLF
nr:transmembrane protein 256 homolog isoform X1 [Arachis hypogaea]